MTRRIEALLAPALRERGDHVALVEGDQSLTYEDLERESLELASWLTVGGVRPGDRVCLALPKSIDSIALVLGVLRAGAAYVPLDPRNPPARLTAMLRSCAPCWLATDQPAAMLAETANFQMRPAAARGVFRLTAVRPSREEPAANEAVFEGARDLAYILFTSGSTGEPKGVPITHENVVGYVSWANAHFGVRPEDRISSHAPLNFDMSVWDIFGTLAAGAELHLTPQESNLTPTLLVDFIARSGLTQWYSVPSVLSGVAVRDALPPGGFPQLKRVIWGGEALLAPALDYWMGRVPGAIFTNVYGPTETTVNCTYHTVGHRPASPREVIPIGLPIPGRRLLILDEDDRPAPPGTVGQLYVGGEGMSPGYWRDPEKTAKAFRNDLPGVVGRWYRTGDLASQDDNGVYHFHGRVDRQIKSRGYRIELDDVGVALGRLPGLEASAVVSTFVGGFEGRRICAAYVLSPGADWTPTSLKAALSRDLPSYMVPRRWLGLPALPRGLSGKADLPAIERMFADG